MKYFNYILICMLMLLYNCNKDEPEKTNTELLTQYIWIHDNEMLDLNNNLKPDDADGIQKDLTFKFNSDGTLKFTNDQVVKQLEWKFANNETAITIIGIMDDSIIPPVEESTHTVYQLDENTLILFYPSTVYNPDIGTFEIYKHN